MVRRHELPVTKAGLYLREKHAAIVIAFSIINEAQKFYLEREEAIEEVVSNISHKELTSFATEYGEVQA